MTVGGKTRRKEKERLRSLAIHYGLNFPPQCRRTLVRTAVGSRDVTHIRWRELASGGLPAWRAESHMRFLSTLSSSLLSSSCTEQCAPLPHIFPQRRPVTRWVEVSYSPSFGIRAIEFQHTNMIRLWHCNIVIWVPSIRTWRVIWWYYWHSCGAVTHCRLYRSSCSAKKRSTGARHCELGAHVGFATNI